MTDILLHIGLAYLFMTFLTVCIAIDNLDFDKEYSKYLLKFCLIWPILFNPKLILLFDSEYQATIKNTRENNKEIARINKEIEDLKKWDF